MADPNNIDLNKTKEIASVFAQHYYDKFDKERAALINMYLPCSIMQFEDELCCGKDEIEKKLANLRMKTVKHVITTVDGQPTVDNGIVIHVLGQLKADEDVPHGFSETFHIKMMEGSYFI